MNEGIKRIYKRGIVVFKDGHEEEVLEFYESTTQKIVDFRTSTGVYRAAAENNDPVKYYKREVVNDPDEGLIRVYLDISETIDHMIIVVEHKEA